MEAVSFQPLLCSVVAFCAAAMHGYTWWLRRKEPAYLWLAVGAIGIIGIAGATAMIYEAADVREAELWQRIMLSHAAVVLYGFYSFTRCLLGLGKLRADPVVHAFAGLMVAQAFWPGLVFGGPAVERHVASIGLHYTAREIGPLGIAFVAAFAAVALYLTTLWVRPFAWACSMNRKSS